MKVILKKQDKMTNSIELHMGMWSLQQTWHLKVALKQKLKSCPTF